MEELAIRRPLAALRELDEIVLPDARLGDVVELVIRTGGHDVALRDLAGYFELIDHIYGRLDQRGFRSYAGRTHGHLCVSEFRSGSLETVFLEAFGTAKPLLVVWLCAKYLPQILDSATSAYKNYQQGRLAKASRRRVEQERRPGEMLAVLVHDDERLILSRENRKRLRHQMEQDEVLSKLPKARRSELARLVDELVTRDLPLLRRASRFSQQHVAGIWLRIKR